jgi:hypothetical protein
MQKESPEKHPKQIAKPRGTKPLHYFLITIATILIAGLIVLIDYGYVYYSSPVQGRFRLPHHDELKPSGTIGHKLGFAGSGMLVLLLIYSVRKRSRFMKGKGALSLWLKFHIFLGVAGPILITFHSAFKLRGIVGISYWSMVIVALSGLLGRYLYAQIPRAISGKEEESAEVEKELDAINTRLAEALEPNSLQKVQQIASFEKNVSASAFRSLFLCLADDFRWWSRKRKLKNFLSEQSSISASERIEIIKLARIRQKHLRQITLLRGSQELFKYWHIFHIPLAQTMYLTMIIHIAVAIKTGYF